MGRKSGQTLDCSSAHKRGQIVKLSRTKDPQRVTKEMENSEFKQYLTL